MPEKETSKPSPYYQPESSVTLFKLRVIQHLEMMRMPAVKDSHDEKCHRDCHIMERNHTIEAIKHFISNVQGVDN